MKHVSKKHKVRKKKEMSKEMSMGLELVKDNDELIRHDGNDGIPSVRKNVLEGMLP